MALSPLAKAVIEREHDFYLRQREYAVESDVHKSLSTIMKETEEALAVIKELREAAEKRLEQESLEGKK